MNIEERVTALKTRRDKAATITKRFLWGAAALSIILFYSLMAQEKLYESSLSKKYEMLGGVHIPDPITNALFIDGDSVYRNTLVSPDLIVNNDIDAVINALKNYDKFNENRGVPTIPMVSDTPHAHYLLLQMHIRKLDGTKHSYTPTADNIERVSKKLNEFNGKPEVLYAIEHNFYGKLKSDFLIDYDQENTREIKETENKIDVIIYLIIALGIASAAAFSIYRILFSTVQRIDQYAIIKK